MIPYVEQPSLAIGPFTLHAFGLLAVAAILVGIAIVVSRAPRSGLDRDAAREVVTWTVVAGLVGSHLFSELFYFPERVASNPLVLFHLWGSMSAVGGILGGLAGAWWTMRRNGFSPLDQARFVEDVAFAFPFAWIFGRAGCALAHDHPGIRSDHWLAVQFPGGSRFDLGLLEFFFAIAVSLAFLALDRRRPPTGTYFGTFFVLYAVFRLALDFLRVGDARYAGLTPSQWTAFAMGTIGLVVLARVFRMRSAPA
jgi:phosphatidylglycerol---prolipoprotein diacylglyceryl transferase